MSRPIKYLIEFDWTDRDADSDQHFSTQADVTPAEANLIHEYLTTLEDAPIANIYVQPFVDVTQTFTEVMAELKSAIEG